MRAEVQVFRKLKSIPELMSMTNGNIFVMFAPANTNGKSDVFIVINRGDAEPVDRTLSDELTLLRASIEVVVYGRTYDKTSEVTHLVQREMEKEWPSASNGEIGFNPIEISNTVWSPFRLEYLIFENIKEH